MDFTPRVMHDSAYLTERSLLKKNKPASETVPAGRGKDQTPHAVKGAAHPGTPALKDKTRTGAAAEKMEHFDLKPTKSNSSSETAGNLDIAWGPLGPISTKKTKQQAREPANKQVNHTGKAPNTIRGGAYIPTTITHNTNMPNTMDRTFTRRPNSKESTASSQRTAISNLANGSQQSSTTLTNSTTNISSLNSGPNAPVPPNFLPGTASDEAMRKPFTIRWGRKYLSDKQSYYPLPFTLSEMHRQVLRSMLLVSVFGSPLCSPLWAAPNPPPKKILEVGCGNGYWSALCHKHFARLGHQVEFTGIDIAPLASDMRAEGMNWRFVQHDLRSVPIPFKNEEFDVIMVKDLALISSALNLTANLMEEYFRCLKPGGQMEVWDSDSTIRLLAPHTPSRADTKSLDSALSENDDTAQATGTGTYVITPQTLFHDAQNPYLVEYNEWITTALTKRGFTTMPCTLMGMLLAQEPQLGDVQTRRIAIPLSQMRWERDDESENGGFMNLEEGKRKLTDAQKSLRETAVTQFVMWIESMEPFLIDASGKSQDEWDRWYGEMMDDLLSKCGTAQGEVLEIGAWWATKKGTVRERKGNSAIAEAKRRRELEREEREREMGGGLRGEDKPSPWPADPHPGKMWEFPGLGN